MSPYMDGSTIATQRHVFKTSAVEEQRLWEQSTIPPILKEDLRYNTGIIQPAAKDIIYAQWSWMMEAERCTYNLRAMQSGNPSAITWTPDEVEITGYNVFNRLATAIHTLEDRQSMDLHALAQGMEEMANGRRYVTAPFASIQSTPQGRKPTVFESTDLCNLDCHLIGDSTAIMANRIGESRAHLYNLLGTHFNSVSVNIHQHRRWTTEGEGPTHVMGIYHALCCHEDELEQQ